MKDRAKHRQCFHCGEQGHLMHNCPNGAEDAEKDHHSIHGMSPLWDWGLAMEAEERRLLFGDSNMYAREQFGDMGRIPEESTSSETINRMTVVSLTEKDFLNPNYCLINAVPGPNQKVKKVPIRATIPGQPLSYEGKVELSPVSNFSLMRRDVFLYCTEGGPNGE